MTSTGPSTTKCQVAAKNSGGQIAAGGGTTTVQVSAAPECAWKATADDSWIADITPNTGQGSAQIEVRAAANADPSPRQATLHISGIDVQVAQDPAQCTFDVSPLTRAIDTAGATTTVTVTTNSACAWTASTDAPWITIASGASGSGSAVVRITAAANTGAPRTGTVVIAGQAVGITQNAANCSFTVAPETANVPATASDLTITVTAGTTNPACTWAAISGAPWITVTSSGSGALSGNVNLTIAPNPGAVRQGTLSIAGRTVTIEQAAASPCTYVVAPTTVNVPAAGGVAAPIAVTAASNCSWTASANATWISITSGASGTANGQVAFTATANTQAATRSGVITIAGQAVAVVQAASTPTCSFSLSGTSQSVTASAGAGTPIGITTTAGCAWTAVSTASWITITSGASGSGSGSVAFTVLANTGTQRSGTLTIAGQTYTVTQAAPCNYSIAPTSQAVAASGDAGNTITVTATSMCSWTAVSNDPWITVNSGAAGTGNGTVTFTVAANAGAARTGTLTVGGQTFTVNQATACTFSINPTSQSPSAGGGSGTAINVTATAGCSWTAVSNDAWLTITSGSSGTGNGTVHFSVAANTGPSRSGTLTIGGQTFSVSQASGCTYQINPTSQAIGASGGAGTAVAVTAGTGCTWTAVSNAAWLTVTSGASGSGNGTVNFTVAATTTDRNGTITIATRTFTVNQSKN